NTTRALRISHCVWNVAKPVSVPATNQAAIPDGTTERDFLSADLYCSAFMTPLQRWTSTVLVLSTILACPVLATDRADKREMISQARAAYYSLRRSGLDSYQVNITVNWDVALGPGQATE